jgi:predicted O-methyltransferase YrrM
MEQQIADLLRDYDTRNRSELALMGQLGPEETQRRIDEFLLSVGPSTGQFLNTLIKDSKARNILEIGTSYGYSTVWLAEAARATGGHVVTLELRPGKREYAKLQLSKVGLGSVVDFRLGDALEILVTLAGPFDFVLLDLWKDLYVTCFDLFLPKLAQDAFVIADNMIQPEAARKDAQIYRKHLRKTGRFDSVLLPIGSGIEVSRLVNGSYVRWR